MKQVLGFLCLYFCQIYFGAAQENLPPPNILWITSEDNSPFLGCYGDTFATTPNLDQFAREGVLYENAFASAPVCAPSRFTLITGIYPTTAGTQNMRSQNAIPSFIRFFPHYLREKGYYCTNNVKKDYNTNDQPDCWDESSNTASWRNRKPTQPFFHVRNFTISHESSIHTTQNKLRHDPKLVKLPPYHPDLPEIRYDWAQYYDKVTQMDSLVGVLLEELEADGLAENTIVFYFSDHGGILGRSKRFLYESGTRVPLIIRFPKKYQHLAPAVSGSRTNRLVSFIDFPATVLSLAGVEVPSYMQGQAFLGTQNQAERRYVFSFRDRMDEKIDMSRSVRDARYRYIKNFMPHRPHLQYLQYLWNAPSMAAWEKFCASGNCNELQNRYFLPKPSEELYDVVNDPHNIYNLADKAAYQSKLKELRNACQNWALQIHDSSFLPEGEMRIAAKNQGIPIYELVRRDDFPLHRIQILAYLATQGDKKTLPQLLDLLRDSNSAIRYWAVTGILTQNQNSKSVKVALMPLLEDSCLDVRVTAAEALYRLGEKKLIMKALQSALDHEELMVRTRALNVLELMKDDARPLLSTIESIAANKAPNYADFDIRAAENILKKFNIKN